VLRDAKAAVSISPTIAVDADGADVPVETSVDGDELTIEVTPGAARFLVLVDPFVAEDQRCLRVGRVGAAGIGEQVLAVAHSRWGPDRTRTRRRPAESASR